MSASTETDILAGLDFTVELPCEASGHKAHHDDEPAALVLVLECPECAWTSTGLICRSGYRQLLTATLAPHRRCGSVRMLPGAEWIKSERPL